VTPDTALDVRLAVAKAEAEVRGDGDGHQQSEPDVA